MELEVFNPWWRGKQYIAEDKHIKEYISKKYKWEPKLFKELTLSTNNIFTLRGPRQVGKTTLIKLLIRQALQKTNEKAIFYWSCDTLLDYNELLNLIRKYLDFSKIYNIKKRFIFLDEISNIKNWQKAIKTLVDSGELSNCCIFLTGSHTLDVKYGIDRLPGRTGKLGKDYVLLPMTFREFIHLINPELSKKLKSIKSLSIKNIEQKIRLILPFSRQLKTLFSQYLITGGFPLTVNEFFTKNSIPSYVEELYVKWVIGDIVKWGKQEKILKQIMRTAILKQASALSWDSFAKDAEIKSHKTVSAYIEDLENMFIFFILYFLNLNKKKPDYGKNKKIYFFDPFIYHVFNKLNYFKSAEIVPSLIEAVAVVHIARFLFEQHKSALAKLNDFLFYWKNKKEVDAITILNGKLFGLEVKYQEKISKSDWASLFPFKEGILVTKNYFEYKRNYIAVPVHLFLALI